MTDENTCARDGCTFHVELVMIGETPMPTVYCGDSCADFEWFRRAIENAAPSRDVAAALQHLNALERLLNERVQPFEVGPLLESLYGR
ncbi:hypothetical protein [Streptomyces hilarionis]|uniref:hypothetical protein n=1 Tax=Streptomyces hilarionis TaxID=2839954 RepID=UPI00211A6274|nr:hypothetical protein [Streptomyces hilarionis]MCQ9134135.1 hypothetical protein [Streptomyces hilarionis]